MNGHVDKRAFSKPLPPNGKLTNGQQQHQQKQLQEGGINMLDEASRNHLCNLMRCWLKHANLDPSLVETLYSLISALVPLWSEAQRDLTSSTTTPESSFSSLFDSIHIQTLAGFKSLKDSRFLPAVYHGEPLSNILSCNLGGSRCEWLHHVVGGTLRIYGAPSGPSGDDFLKIVAASVYTLWSLWLEMHLARDSHILSSLPLQRQQAQNGDDTTVSIRGILPRKRSGIINWLWPKSNAAVETKTIKNPNEKNPIINRSTTPPCCINPAQDDPHRFAKLRQRLEQATMITSSPHCRFTAPKLIVRLQDEEDGIDTIRAVMRMKNNNNNSSNHKNGKPNGIKRRASSLLSMVASQSPQQQQQQQQKRQSAPVIPPVDVPQSISAYSSLRCMNDKKIGMEYLLLDTQSVDSYLEHQQITLSYAMHPIGCPQSPCAGPLLSRLNYFRYENSDDRSLGEVILHWCTLAGKETVCKSLLQSKLDMITKAKVPDGITTPSVEEKHITPTNGTTSNNTGSSVASSTEKERDGQRSRRTSALQSSLHGCQKKLTDHVMTFAHGSARAVVYIIKNDNLPQTTKAVISSCNDSNKTLASPNSHEIYIWFACATCDAETSPTLMSLSTYHYSFAKYIELILYHDTYFAPQSLPCGHPVTRSSVIRCFGPSNTSFTVKFSYESISLYELRAPRLQVVPSAKHVSSKIITTGAVSPKTLKNWREIIRDDVIYFFETVSTHLDVLKQFAIAESKRAARSSIGSGQKQTSHTLQDQLKLRENELASMKKLFGETEHRELLLELQRTPLESLNDYRRLFALRSTAILSQLAKWQHQWCPDLMDDCTWDPPDYIKSDKVHAFPGSSVLVREEEPSSMIAYTLSSIEYLEELKQQYGDANTSAKVTIAPKAPPPPPPSITSSASSAADDHKAKNAQNQNNEEDDRNSSGTLDRSGSYYTFIKRKFVAPNAGAASETASFRAMVIETVKANASELHYQQQRKVQEIRDRWATTTHQQQQQQQEPASSSRLTPGGENNTLKKPADPHLTTSQRVILDEPRIQRGVTTEVAASTYYQKPLNTTTTTTPDNGDGMKSKEKPLPPIATTSTTASTGENRRLSPHIKHKYIHNNVEFTCIVYYASEFESLRRQSGIDQLLIQSLSRCNAWKATGGKSKSHFYRSQDGRLVIKEMVNAWNNVEKESILKFAPKYFDYMKKTDEVPSVLAKIFGFYTIRIRGMDDKRVILNLDVLVMEHLFYGIVPQSIQKFDFKGIRDRHVEECRKQGDTTLWDGDWLQDYRLHCPVSEQSKALIEKAIKSDTEFLSQGNIMDYSLLLGVDEARKELTVGIVDFIGAYTWYKKVESRSKSTLNPNKEVTVVPPDQYKWRFHRIINDYFVAVSGKFDKVQASHLVSSAILA